MAQKEHLEQVHLINWFRVQYPLIRNTLFAIPNGGVRNIGTAIKLKKEGVMPGVSDLFLMVPKGLKHGLFVEMKAEKGKIQENQAEFMKLADQMGYGAVVCYGFLEAKEAIQNYLKQ
jgi:hypothetical protein